jgi:hypothetical protein
VGVVIWRSMENGGPYKGFAGVGFFHKTSKFWSRAPLELHVSIERDVVRALHAARDEWALFSAPLFGRPRAGAAAPVPVPPLALSVSVTLCVTLPRLARSRPKPPGSL